MNEIANHRHNLWHFKFPWVWIAATASVLLLVAFFWPPVSASREAAPRSRCKNNLKQILLAMHDYHEKYGTFPPAYIADANGKPMHSWRVLLLPFVELKPLYERYRFDEPWNGPHNRKLHGEIVDVYRCPKEKPEHETNTSYVVVIGPRTIFPGCRGLKLSDVKDGTSNVLAVVEYRNSGIHWMEPRDLEISRMVMKVNAGYAPSIASRHTGGANAAFADGSVRFLPEEIPETALRQLLQIDDGTPKDEW